MGFAGVAWVAGVALEPVLPNREFPVAPPPPNSPPGLLAGVPWLTAGLSCPKTLPAGAVVVGVVLVVVAAVGVEDVLPKRLVLVPADAAAGLPPNILVLGGVIDELPKRLPLVPPPPKEGEDELGAALVVALKSGFCSAGFVVVLPNKPPPDEPEEAGVALLPAPAVFPKAKVGLPFVWLPKRPPEVVGVVEDPNSPPPADELDVVALLGCPEELEAPKEDMI